MFKTLIIILVRNLVPMLLERLITDDKHPSVTDGMVRDYEVKVGVEEETRIKRATAREKRLASRGYQRK